MRYFIYFFAFIGALAIAYFAFIGLTIYGITDGEMITFDNDEQRFEVNLGSGNHLGNVIYYDHEARSKYLSLQSLSKGSAKVEGVVLFDGKPASDLSIELNLNGKYLVDSLVTDSQGKYSFNLPEGEWKITHLSLATWEHKPEGNIVVTTGRGDLSNNQRYFRARNQHLPEFALAKDSVHSLETIHLTKEIEILNPEASDESITVSSPESFIIDWLPHQKASQYYVQLWKVNDSHGSRSTIASRVVNIHSIELIEFDLVESPKDEKNHDYSVSVVGFDDSGEFVSESSHYPYANFSLEGYQIIDDQSKKLLNSVSSKYFLELKNNKIRLEYAELLVQNNNFNDAEKILENISGNKDEAEFLLVNGLLSAKQGNCEVANDFFDQAIKIKGKNCVPESYRQYCSLK